MTLLEALFVRVGSTPPGVIAWYAQTETKVLFKCFCSRKSTRVLLLVKYKNRACKGTFGQWKSSQAQEVEIQEGG